MFQLGGLGVVIMIIFGFWIFMGEPGYERMDRACKPVEKTGNIITSLAAVTWNETAGSINNFWEGVDYSCEYMLWRLFHEDTYLKAQRDAEEGNDAAFEGDEVVEPVAPIVIQ